MGGRVVSCMRAVSYTHLVDNVYSPEGYCIWNHGIAPDIEVWQTLEDLKNRKDTVLNTAIITLEEILQKESN